MNLTTAIERGKWDVAALRLLLAVSEAARKLPPGGSRELLALLDRGSERGRSA